MILRREFIKHKSSRRIAESFFDMSFRFGGGNASTGKEESFQAGLRTTILISFARFLPT